MGPFAVGVGVDVGPAGEHQPVDHVEHEVGLLHDRLVRRQHQREPAGALNGRDVAARKQERLLVPIAPARPLD